MNQKIAIWKRKLAKEKLRQQMKIWDRLKQTHPKKRVLRGSWSTIAYDDFNTFALDSDLEEKLVKEMAAEIDREILNTIMGKIK